MSKASPADVMAVLTVVPMDRVCHWTMKDAMAPVHLQLSAEHVVVFQKKKKTTTTIIIIIIKERLTPKKLISSN